MNKVALLATIVAQLSAELERLSAAALATHGEATDTENRAENKYDTRGLEASYLAQGQSDAASETAQAIAQFRALTLCDGPSDGPVTLGTLVTVADTTGRTSRYFVGPRAGGTEVKQDGETVMVITPSSPLGRQLIGRRAGDTLTPIRANRPGFV
jgi:transcription elongation GreA/GreB family factor